MTKNQQNHVGTFLYLRQIKVVLFVVISATSYYWFLGSTPFEITRSATQIRKNTGVHRINLAMMKRRGISIP